MLIQVFCNGQCNDLLVRKVKRAACGSGSFKERVHSLALEHGKEAVVDAVMQASKDGMFDLTWDEETVQDWLRDYLFEECFDDLIDIGEDELPIAC